MRPLYIGIWSYIETSCLLRVNLVLHDLSQHCEVTRAHYQHNYLKNIIRLQGSQIVVIAHGFFGN